MPKTILTLSLLSLFSIKPKIETGNHPEFDSRISEYLKF